MPVFLIEASMQSTDTTLDGFSNQFVYTSVASGAINVATAQDIIAIVNGFYQQRATGATSAIGLHLSPSLNTNAGIEYKAYDITGKLSQGQLHGAPITQLNKPWTIGSLSASSFFPEGVAACISFRRDYGTDVEFIRGPGGVVTGRPRQSDRGRMYVGPLNSAVMTGDGTTLRCKFTPGFVTDCLAAFDFASTVVATDSTTWHLSQWSKKKGNVADIVATWMDDRPDYQRRRADQSAARTNGTFSY